MKLTLIFMSTFLVVSHQQYNLANVFAYPRLWPAFVQQQSYYNDHLPNNRYNYLEDYYSVEQQVDRPDNPAGSLIALNQEEDKKVQPRIKGYGIKLQSGANQQQNARFYFNSGVNQQVAVNAAVVNQGVVNPLLKTVTFTLTSTCTSYSVVTCVPVRFVVNAVRCARKRQIDSVEPLSDNSQFPIVPTKIQKVESSTHPNLWPIASRDSRQTLFDVVSSKEEQPINESNKHLQVVNMPRNGRFYNLWQSFATGTTITSWTIISSTTTLTSIPTPAGAAAVPLLNCLPAGLSFC